MPIWTDTPPTDSTQYGYRLVRCPAARPLHATVLSDRVIGTPTHYHKGRTIPCDGPNCRICADGSPWRWHGYLAMIVVESKEKVLLELTGHAADQLKKALADHGTLRGLDLIVERPAKRPNGRLRVMWRRNGASLAELPQAPDCRKLLLHIWGLDQAVAIDKQITALTDNIGIDKTAHAADPISRSADL